MLHYHWGVTRGDGGGGGVSIIIVIGRVWRNSCRGRGRRGRIYGEADGVIMRREGRRGIMHVKGRSGHGPLSRTTLLLGRAVEEVGGQGGTVRGRENIGLWGMNEGFR